MKPQLEISIVPDNTTDYALVTLKMMWRDQEGVWQTRRIYQQLRIAQGITTEMQVEPWALASVTEHVNAITAALTERINQGSVMLMSDAMQQLLF